MGTKNLNSATDLITFSRASSSTFLGSNGLIQTATNNTPRIEYDADGTVKGLLIEEARTNLLTYSEDFSNSFWSKASVVRTPNATTSPDGSLTAYKFAPSTTNASHTPFFNVNQSITNGTYSVFAKSAGENYIFLKAAGGSITLANSAVFNLSNGTVSNTPSGYTTTIEDYGNGWYRCSMTTNISGTRYQVGNTADGTDFYYAGNNVDGVYLYGAQVEAGAFPTSYIPTTGSTATRAADFAQIPTSAFGFKNDKGSLVIDVLTPVAEQYMALGFFNTANYNNSRSLWKSNPLINGVGDDFVFQTYDGTVTKFAIGQQNQAEHTKLGLSYGGNEKAVKDGGTVFSGISRYPNPTRLFLGGRDDGYQSQCWIKSIKYYPRRLSDTQLQELTT